jgi:hypothetical protein
MFPLWIALVGGSFVFMDVGFFHFFPCFPFLGALVYLRSAGFHHNRKRNNKEVEEVMECAHYSISGRRGRVGGDESGKI